MGEAQVPVCRFFNQGDEETVKQLVENIFRDFLKGKYWDWKYKLNPNFDATLVAVAEDNGKIIGCNHWLPRKLKISDLTEANAVLGADIAVIPEYRGRGVGKLLLLFLRSEAIRDKNVVLSYMFADSNLSKRLYSPVAGYIPAPTVTTSYFKLLNWSKLESRINIVNEEVKNERKLPKTNLKILFEIYGAPPLFLELNEKGIIVGKGDTEKENVTVVSDLSTMFILKENRGRLRNLIRALFTRKLKIKGNLPNLIRFYRNFWLIEKIFSGKIS